MFCFPKKRYIDQLPHCQWKSSCFYSNKVISNLINGIKAGVKRPKIPSKWRLLVERKLKIKVAGQKIFSGMGRGPGC